MKLSNTSKYALRILIYMAKSPEALYSASQLVSALDISDKYLRRLMTDLSKSGFIQSIQGRDGGYRFAKAIDSIYLYDVIASVESLDTLSGCVLGFEECSCTNPCAMHDTWMKIRLQLNEVYRDTRLSDLDFDHISKY